MCQNSVVVQVVNGFVKNGYMFTAFDVTKFLRASGENVRHSDVNSAVKQMFRDGEINGYLRDIKDVGAPVSPFVYYHQNADLDDYVEDWLENNPDQDGMKNDGVIDDGSGVMQPSPSTLGSAPSKVPVVTKTTKTAKTALPKGIYSLDKEGRLYIAPVLTKSAGLQPKQSVFVEVDNGTLVIASSNMNMGWPYSVNKDGRIRLCRSLLSQIATPSATTFKVTTACGVIEIAQA